MSLPTPCVECGSTARNVHFCSICHAPMCLRCGEKHMDDKHPGPERCPKCGGDRDWIECENCGGEIYVEHDCGEDTCCCADPEPNVACEDCSEQGGWWRCLACHPMSDAEAEARR